jgi:hypothetical protein
MGNATGAGSQESGVKSRETGAVVSGVSIAGIFNSNLAITGSIC